MEMPSSTIDSVGDVGFDEKKAYVQVGEGQAFVRPDMHIFFYSD